MSTGTLLPHHLDQLHASAISDDVIAERGYWSATTKAKLERLGFGKAQRNTPALVIPICNVHAERVLYQIKPDVPRVKDGKALRYETPSGAGLVLDVPQRAYPHLGNPAVPLWFTEGAKKVDSAVSHGLCCVGLIGVYGFRHTNSHNGKVAIPDLQYIAWNDRKVYLAFDSDAMENPQVHAALAQFAALIGPRP